MSGHRASDEFFALTVTARTGTTRDCTRAPRQPSQTPCNAGTIHTAYAARKRLADDGPRACGYVRDGPASATLHRS